MLSGIHNIHFIGIGGAGMSALAHVLCERGFHVSGSDKNAGGICEKLKALGAVVYQGHASGQVMVRMRLLFHLPFIRIIVSCWQPKSRA